MAKAQMSREVEHSLATATVSVGGVPIPMADAALNGPFNQAKESSVGHLVMPATMAEPPRHYLVIKRAADIILSGIGLIFLAPLFIVIAIIIKLESKGPVLIPVKALRKGGRTFNEWKFRTMVEDADDILKNDDELRAEFFKKFKLERDPRVTTMGRWLRRTSLNELPQLLNVLKGEMSLVGPRSIAVDEDERYGPLYVRMLTATSGMTGLWQVSGRQNTSYEKRVELDMYYIEHRSLMLDLKLLLMTVPAVLGMKGAF